MSKNKKHDSPINDVCEILKNERIALINDQKSQHQKIDREYEATLKIVNNMQRLIVKYAYHKEFTDPQMKEILGITCYGNLAYCCGLQKNCIRRNTALQILHISPEEYVKKEKVVADLYFGKSD